MNRLFGELFKDFWLDFDQVFGQFLSRKYNVEFHWVRKYSVEFYWDRKRLPANYFIFFLFWKFVQIFGQVFDQIFGQVFDQGSTRF